MDLSWVLGHATTTFHHAKQTVPLHTKTGSNISIADLCKEVTPPCHLNPLLFNGHLQTMWTAVSDVDIPIIYRRKVFEAEDPAYEGSFAVDFVTKVAGEMDDTLPPRTSYYSDQEFGELGSSDATPMLVVLHGLSGGSHEIYLRHVLAPLVLGDGGWEACVVNARGCAKSKITGGVLFNARATWDVRQVIRWLKQKFPKRPLFAVGFSLGANILTNYCGEEGATCLLKGAVVCSNPWDLEISAVKLRSTYLGNEVYNRVMGSNMKKLYEQHETEITKRTKIDPEGVRKATYLFEFDREVQCPCWGYPTVSAYYRDASSADSVLAVRIPFFAINAQDDPIAVNEAIPYEEFTKNPYTVLCATSTGGHLSWFQSNGERWFAKPIVNFLNKMVAEIDFEASELTISRQATMEPEYENGLSHYVPMRRKLQLPHLE